MGSGPLMSVPPGVTVEVSQTRADETRCAAAV
jgi:hypothetical protein